MLAFRLNCSSNRSSLVASIASLLIQEHFSNLYCIVIFTTKIDFSIKKIVKSKVVSLMIRFLFDPSFFYRGDNKRRLFSTESGDIAGRLLRPVALSTSLRNWEYSPQRVTFSNPHI